MTFLFDVDNTLLDHDRVKEDLGELLDERVSAGASTLYWSAYEAHRRQAGDADFLAAFQACWVQSGHDPRWLHAGDLLLDYPFSERLFPGALEVLEQLSRLAVVAIVSDGDAVLQPRKIRRAGLWQAVAQRVLIYQDKQQNLADIGRRLPARHYVMVDDKPAVLEHMKSAWRGRLTTVFPVQGHYARDAVRNGKPVAVDIRVDNIADLLELDEDVYLDLIH